MLERRDLTKKGAYFMSCSETPIRGIEGFMMDSAVLWHHIWKGREGPLAHVIIQPMGIFKGETGIRNHL